MHVPVRRCATGAAMMMWHPRTPSSQTIHPCPRLHARIMSCRASGTVSIALAVGAGHSPRTAPQPLNRLEHRTHRRRRHACAHVVAGAEPPAMRQSRLFVFGFGFTTLALTRALTNESADWCVTQQAAWTLAAAAVARLTPVPCHGAPFSQAHLWRVHVCGEDGRAACFWRGRPRVEPR